MTKRETQRDRRSRAAVRNLICAVMLLLSFCCSFCGCTAKKEQEETFFAMDTYMSLRAQTDDGELLGQIRDGIVQLEHEISVTEKTSAVWKLNHEGEAQMSPAALELLETALETCGDTDGALDITVYPVLRAGGFTTDTYRVPDAEEIGALLGSVGWNVVRIEGDKVTVPEGTMIDLGSVAKGYAADLAAERLKQAGVENAILDLGGSIVTLGSRPDGNPWRVAVRAPEGDGLLGVLSSRDEAVVTSGGYERYFEDDEGNIWWHILDPGTGYPAHSGLVSVTVVGPQGVRCDALSTALFVMGEEKACAYWRAERDFGMILVTEDGRLLVTQDLEGRFEKDPSCAFELEVIAP